MTYGIIGVGQIAEAIVIGLCTGDEAAGRLLALFDRLGSALAVENIDAFSATTATLAAHLSLFTGLTGDGSSHATPGGIDERFAALLDAAIDRSLDAILERLRI